MNVARAASSAPVSGDSGVGTPPKCALSAGDVVAARPVPETTPPLARSAFFLCFQNSWRLT
jgi:hypothetical protein